jgi:hypothetical protein
MSNRWVLVPLVLVSACLPTLRGASNREWVIGYDSLPIMSGPPAVMIPDDDYPGRPPLTGIVKDLNGDRVADYIVRLTRCGTGGCPYRIVDGATLKEIGAMFGYPVIVRAERSHGFPNIDVYSHLGASSGTFTSYVFDGKTYVERSRRNIEGCEAGDSLFKQINNIPRWRPGR